MIPALAGWIFNHRAGRLTGSFQEKNLKRGVKTFDEAAGIVNTREEKINS